LKLSNAKKLPSTRIQYAALPFKRNGDTDLAVMLVTSRDTRRWVIPKGWPIGRKAPHASAAREALEEAGVVGKVGRNSIGTYTYEKRLAGGTTVLCDVQVFPLEVKRQRKEWPEKAEREFRWFSPADAASVVREAALRDIILSVCDFSKAKRSLNK
jgi:8-oxo-dGTP pyrophosphatase MutT (NUDIX family)